MEILKHFRKNLNYKDIHTQILAVIFCLLLGIAHIYIFLTNGRSIDIIQIICQFILILIISIWVFGAPGFYYDIKILKKLFKSKQYKDKYRDYLDLMNQFNYKKWSVKRSILELIYTFLWFFLFINAIVQLFHFKFIPSNLIGIITISLYVMAVYLNYFSCHMSFCLVFLICQITGIKDLDYNKKLPSATWGLQLLRDNLLYIIFYCYYIFPTAYRRNKEFN